MKGICCKCGLKKDVLFYEQKGRVSLCICHECLDKEKKDKILSEDIDTAIKKFEESSNKKCSKGDGCYICESCKTQLKKRIIYYLKRRVGENNEKKEMEKAQ